jgi:hypothetical protein
MTDISQEAREAELQLIDYLLSLGARGDDNETAIANETLAGLFDDYRTEIECAAEQRGRLAGLGDDEVIAESKIVEIADSFEKRTGQPSERWNTACDHIAQAIRDAKENEHG